MNSRELPEPWLRGPITGVDPLLAPLLYAFQQAREDLARNTEGLTDSQVWSAPHGFGSVGFHLRHIAGSVDRLMIYAQGHQLSAEQIRDLEEEKSPAGPGRDELLAKLDEVLRRAEAAVRSMDPSSLREVRDVGRKRLPSTVIGLLTHVAEHTARHVGQAISAAKWARIAPA
jgi:uncharacterized damage-inducible protein DinB